MYESHLTSPTCEPLKKIVKTLETRPQSSQNSQKRKKQKKIKIHEVDKSTLLFGFL